MPAHWLGGLRVAGAGEQVSMLGGVIQAGRLETSLRTSAAALESATSTR